MHVCSLPYPPLISFLLRRKKSHFLISSEVADLIRLKTVISRSWVASPAPTTHHGATRHASRHPPGHAHDLVRAFDIHGSEMGSGVLRSGRSTLSPLSFTIRAGVPSTVLCGGISCMMMKELAPIRVSEPTVIGPNKTLFVPMSTLSPIVGCRFPVCFPVP